MSDSCNPMDSSLPGSSVHGILQGKNTGVGCHFLIYICEVAQSCPTLCNPMDCSLPGSSVHGIFQARIMEWVAFPFSKGASLEIKRCLLLGRKAMTNLDRILKSRDITLPTKVRLVKAFPVVMYGCESWTVKKAER